MDAKARQELGARQTEHTPTQRPATAPESIGRESFGFHPSISMQPSRHRGQLSGQRNPHKCHHRGQQHIDSLVNTNHASTVYSQSVGTPIPSGRAIVQLRHTGFNGRGLTMPWCVFSVGSLHLNCFPSLYNHFVTKVWAPSVVTLGDTARRLAAVAFANLRIISPSSTSPRSSDYDHQSPFTSG